MEEEWQEDFPFYLYEEGEILGLGEFGSVSRYTLKEGIVGEEARLPKQIAVKVKESEEKDQRTRYLIRSLRHENLVKYIVCGTKSSRLNYQYICMEPCHTDLSQLQMEKGNHFEPFEVLMVLRQILTAIDHLHSRKVIHRDIKPSNILLILGDGNQSMGNHTSLENAIVKLSIATTSRSWPSSHDDCSFTGTLCGTFNYIAPEMIQILNNNERTGRYSVEVDIWACGIVAYKLFTGKLPELYRYSTAEIENDPNLPEEFKSFLLAQLQPDYHDRWSAAQLLEHDFIRYFDQMTNVSMQSRVEISDERSMAEEKLLEGCSDFPVMAYFKDCKLGKGGQGNVYRWQKSSTDDTERSSHLPEAIAVKELNKPGKDALREQDILRKLDPHQNIIKYHCHFQVQDGIIGLAMELCAGTVGDFHMARKLKFYEVSSLMSQTLEGLAYLHKKGIVHRDVKPENLLLHTRHTVQDWTKVFVSDMTVKLCDFGLSRRFNLEIDGNDESQTFTPVGTRAYEAPEILRAAAEREYASSTSSTDIWSTGILTYKLVMQKLPDMPQHKTDNIESDLYLKQHQQLLPFILQQLVLDKHFRASAEELLQHDFICDNLRSDDTFEAIEIGDAAHLTMLISAIKTSPGMKDARDKPTLCRAAQLGNVSVLRCLVENGGAEVNGLRDMRGNYALHCAARCGMLDAVKYLVEEAGADTKLKNRIGETALAIAKRAKKGEVEAFLAEHN